ncbi:amino acid ABC transporter [Desulfomarina profundi]|uniref:Amino acid ABC transporter n=1 Tax=Desulfomarina profundi TaxID=2772557 RepID=A0A8D5FNI5_9BACT|nr:transporter substrate-binding domain-containing protein [Desulfomarina profundi]BCL61484.1 amino acid ABC transporter [Desulfomarina profundi]
MRKTICVLIVIGLCAVFSSVSAQDIVRIANETATPPFNFVDGNGKVQGFDVEIAAALCDVMGVKKVDVIQDWDGMIPGLIAKKFDAIISDMSITDKRLKVVNFSQSYYDEQGLFLARKGENIDFSVDGMKGKKVAVQRATTFANYIKGIYGSSVDIKYYETPASQILDLLSGRVDLILASDVFVHKTIKTKDGEKLAIVGSPVKDKKYIGDGVGIAVRKQDKELLENFNKALDTIKSNGTYDKIYNKWFM